jgi:hypothetical protein
MVQWDGNPPGRYCTIWELAANLEPLPAFEIGARVRHAPTGKAGTTLSRTGPDELWLTVQLDGERAPCWVKAANLEPLPAEAVQWREGMRVKHEGTGRTGTVRRNPHSGSIDCAAGVWVDCDGSHAISWWEARYVSELPEPLPVEPKRRGPPWHCGDRVTWGSLRVGTVVDDDPNAPIGVQLDGGGVVHVPADALRFECAPFGDSAPERTMVPNATRVRHPRFGVGTYIGPLEGDPGGSRVAFDNDSDDVLNVTTATLEPLEITESAPVLDDAGAELTGDAAARYERESQGVGAPKFLIYETLDASSFNSRADAERHVESITGESWGLWFASEAARDEWRARACLAIIERWPTVVIGSDLAGFPVGQFAVGDRVDVLPGPLCVLDGERFKSDIAGLRARVLRMSTRETNCAHIAFDGGNERAWVHCARLRLVERTAPAPAPRAPYEPPAIIRSGPCSLPASALRALVSLRQCSQQLEIAIQRLLVEDRSDAELAFVGLHGVLHDTNLLARQLEGLAIEIDEPDSADSIVSVEVETQNGKQVWRGRCLERRGRFVRLELEGAPDWMWFDLKTETALFGERGAVRLIDVVYSDSPAP